MFQHIFGLTLIAIGILYIAYGVMEISRPHGGKEEVQIEEEGINQVGLNQQSKTLDN